MGKNSIKRKGKRTPEMSFTNLTYMIDKNWPLTALTFPGHWFSRTSYHSLYFGNLERVKSVFYWVSEKKVTSK